MTEAQVRRYARQLTLGDVGGRGQRRLLEATLVLAIDEARPAAHCALAYLAAAGVGRIELAGPAGDAITAAEVAGSPLLVAGDAGQPRLEALRRRVAALNPDVELAAAGGDAAALEIAEPGAGLAEALVSGSRAAAAAIHAVVREDRGER